MGVSENKLVWLNQNVGNLIIIILVFGYTISGGPTRL